MAYTKLGRIRPVYSGEWNSGRAYTALEMVRTSDGGLSYIAQKDVPAGTPLTNGEYWAVVLDVREVLEAAKNAADRINNVMDVKANALSATAAGNPVQFSPDEHSIIKPVLTLLPVQSGSGDPSPSNIRPIAGRTGAVLTRSGKNLLKLSGAYVNGWNITNIPNGLKPNRQYVFSVVKSGGISFAVYAMTGLSAGESEKTVKLTESYYNEGGYGTFTTPADITDYKYIVLAGSASGIASVFSDVKFQLELGSTATPFEPYQGDTYTLDFGQTVYGGKVDVNKGELVVDWAKVTLPSSANWVKSISAKNGYYLGDGNIFVPQKLYMCPVLCNVAKYTSNVEEYKANYGMVYSDSTISLNVDPAVCGSTLESFKAWLDSTEVQIAYKLANPITIRLTPQQITALAGVNTVCGDADEITVNYNKDLATAFAEVATRLAALETALTNA